MANKNAQYDFTELQRAWLEAWANGARSMIEGWRHIFEMQQKFLTSAAEQHHRYRTEISDGPSFTDKYGKRAHDIDPERDV